MLIKMSVVFLCGAISLPLFAATDCAQRKGCERKFCEIEVQLAYAYEHNNKEQISGLKKSLENSKKYCTNQSLENDLTTKVAKVKSDLADYEMDLAQAEKSGKTEKARKYKRKIAEKRAELKQLERELAELK